LRKITILLLFVIAFVIAPLALADSGVWGERGIGKGFAVRGSLLFEADGRGISVYDTRGASPSRIAVVPTASESEAIAAGDDLYVLTRTDVERYAIADNGALTLRATMPNTGFDMIAAGDGYLATSGPSRLTLWSTTAGDTPVIAAELPHSGNVTAMAFHGAQLWVAVQDQAIYGFDLVRGTQPLGTIAANAGGLAIQGDTLYAAAGANGLVIADVSDVGAPRELARIGAGEVDLVRIAAGGNTVWASDGDDRIRVYDVSTPAAPRLATTINDYSQELASDGTRLFAGGTLLDQWHLPSVTPLRFSVYAANGTRTGSFSDNLGGPVSGAATDGTFAYVIDYPYFRVFDISTPSQPKPLAAISFPAMQDYVKIHNGLAIVYGRGKLNLVDIHNPWQPRFLGTYDSLGMPGGGATFAGDTIVEANPETGMHVLDFFKLTTPDKPVQIGGIIWHYFELVSLPSTLYMFDFTLLRVADLSDPHNPHTAREVPVPPGPATIVAAESASPHLVVESGDRFHIFDLTQPLNPIEVGGAALPPARGPVATDGDSAVLVAIPGEIDRLDISDPAHPSLLKSGMTAFAPMQISVSGSKVVVADRYSLRVYGDVTPAPAQAPARRRTAGR
jgi:hypothetical protein